MKPLTTYKPHIGHDRVFGDPEAEMRRDYYGRYYAKDEADARIAELEAELETARATNSVKVGDMMEALYSTYLSLTAGDSYDAERYMRQEFWRRMAIAAIDAARGVTK